MAHHLERLDQPAAFPADAGRLCFADEAAIDFPSVHAAVSRIREAFVGEGGDRPIEIPVAIGRFDARVGREVVVTVPLRHMCGSCGGRGEVWAESCPACGGCGDALEARDITLVVPPGVRDGSRVRVRVGRRFCPPTHVVLLVSIR
jgi:hypothetical protein